jgi:hypothetical protein
LEYTNIVFGEEEIDNFVLIVGRVLVDKFEYTLLSLKGHVARTSLYTKVRGRYYSKILKINV